MSGKFLPGQATLDPSPSGVDSESPDPLLTPSKILQGGLRQAHIPSRPTPNLKTFQGKIPQAMATYVPEDAKTDLQSRFKQSPQDDRARDD